MGGPDLMLPDIGCHHRVTLGMLIDQPNDLLWIQRSCSLIAIMRHLPLPSGRFLRPIGLLGPFHVSVQPPQQLSDIPAELKLHGNVLVQLGIIDVHMNLPGVRGERFRIAG
ncbi:hypothetical protein D3C81_1455150 [compost metagenome]